MENGSSHQKLTLKTNNVLLIWMSYFLLFIDSAGRFVICVSAVSQSAHVSHQNNDKDVIPPSKAGFEHYKMS